MSSPTIAFIGLGRMGSALAHRLRREHSIAVHDIVPKNMEPFVLHGVDTFATLRDLPENRRMVFTCLPTTEMVEALIFQDQGLADLLGPTDIIVDMSTGSPDVAKRIAARLGDRGILFADAPVSGGPQAAEAGTIAIMVGAEVECFKRIESILNSISPKVTRMGPVGAGSVMKLINNMLAAGNRLLAFEAVAIASSQGLNVRQCIDVVNRSSGRNNATETTFPRHIFSDQLEQHFSLGLSLKDVVLATKLLPPSLREFAISPLLCRVLERAAERIGAHQDINLVIRMYEDAAGAVIAHRTAANDT
jgi:3-hydroxyisobutyrate dehydrogenase